MHVMCAPPLYDTAEQRRLIPSLTSGTSVAFEVVGADAVSAWQGVMGPSDPADARAAAPDSIRARFGKSLAANAVYGSASADDAAREVELLFGGELTYTATYRSCALCLVKPHAVTAGAFGSVLEALFSSGLTVTAIRSVQLTRAQAEDFLEVYRGVVDEAPRCAQLSHDCMPFKLVSTYLLCSIFVVRRVAGVGRYVLRLGVAYACVAMLGHAGQFFIISATL